jgi:hypothetical protein
MLTSIRIVLQVLKEWLPRLWQEHRPQLVIFQAGVDALKEDAFGRSAAILAHCAPLEAWLEENAYGRQLRSCLGVLCRGVAALCQHAAVESYAL